MLCWPVLVARALPPVPDDFVNDETTLLFVVDLAQATPATLDATGRGIVEYLPEFGEYYEKLRADYEAATNAGGRILVVAAAQTRNQDVYAFMPVVGLFVDADNCDEPALIQLLRKHGEEFCHDPVIERHDDWLLLWESQRRILIDPPKNGPELEIPGFDPERCARVRAAYQALDGRAMGVTMIPTAEMHKEAQAEWDALPQEIHDSGAGLRMLGMLSLHLHGWIDLGHNPSVTGVIELAQATQATQFVDAIKTVTERFKLEATRTQEHIDAGDEPEVAPSEMALAGRIIGSLSCVQQGSTVTVSIGQADLRPILDMAGPMLVKRRRQAQEMVLMSNARQISISLIMYADNHDNQWPDSLDLLAETRLMNRQQLDELMKHPVTGEKIAFEYIKPDKPIDRLENAADVAVLRELEKGAIKKDGITCYADGHVEAGS